ncbi:MAG: Tetratricopeptide repeat-containing protein, partial [Verrucomicrobiaceae bacterium]|nr:Tetratricopeptide repeat-containing protein [Verrucomicrobiaceae bacterium]
LWDDNKKDTSVATLREFVTKYPDHPFAAQGNLSLASRLESMGGKDVAEAKTIFEKLAKDEGKSDIGSLAQLRLGDLLWNEGKVDEAKKVYEGLPQRMTGSPFFEHNSERLKWLAAGLPAKEVEGPKPPPDSIKAPSMNLNSGASKSPLGSLMPNLKEAVPGAKLDVKPVAVPAPPKPGVATPGAALPVPTPPVKATPPAATTSAPVQAPAPPASPSPAKSAPEPANPAKPNSATPAATSAPVVPPAPSTSDKK